MLKALYKELLLAFQNNGIDTPELDARYILQERCEIDWSDLIANPDKHIPQDQINLVNKDAAERLSGKPLSRIYGAREFWGAAFKVTQDTLDPRPDTETIIDLALLRFPVNSPLDILDLGTGTGCILIALLREFKNANGIGVDISQGAIDCARENALHNNCDGRVEFLHGSWLTPVSGSFDLIVSNPPYIKSAVIHNLSAEVKNHDPILALDGGDDGLTPYKIIFPQLKNVLKKDGIALFEIGYDQEEDIMRLAEESGFAQRIVHLDIAGNPRVVEISCGDK